MKTGKWNKKCSVLLRPRCLSNRLAALAPHGRQICKQSGVVLERSVKRTTIKLVVIMIREGIVAVIHRKLKPSFSFFSLLLDVTLGV